MSCWVDVWPDEERLLLGERERVWRVTVWRVVGGEVDVDGPHVDPRPGYYTRREAFVVARRVARRMRGRRLRVWVTHPAAGRFRAESVEEAYARIRERVDGPAPDRPTHRVSTWELVLAGGRAV